MHETSLNIEQGMQTQLQHWQDSVASQGLRLGWKIGFNRPIDQQRLGLPSPMVGYLSRGQQILSGDSFRIRTGANILVEAEVALCIGDDVAANASHAQAEAAIAAYAPALELVDTTLSRNDNIEAILSGNLFHAAVMLGEPHSPQQFFLQPTTLSLAINGEQRGTLEADRLPTDFVALVLLVANTLARQGETLKQGDWIITGAASTPLAVARNDRVDLNMAGLGQLTLILE